jgi:hypothetical protein
VQGLDEATRLLTGTAHGGVDQFPAFVLAGRCGFGKVGGHFHLI